MGHNGNWDGFVACIVFVSVIRTPHYDSILASFVGLQHAEARLIIKYKKAYAIFHYYKVRKEKTWYD